ncbi:MAG: radical SAM protein [Deltaproteobacteria bacterium]|nr:radical SAM protein [Deltaproteobacteria bacterium]
MANITTLLRKRLSEERGTVTKDWGGKISIALIYPNYYQVGMSNLGFQVVYGILNDNPHIISERAFLPNQEELSLYERADQALLSLESQTPLRAFDLLAFSLSFENDYPNILTILELSKIPLLSKERGENDPFVVAGGVATFMNPEPLAPFIDCFLLGEGEVVLKDFFRAYGDIHLRAVKRQEVLRVLAEEVEGAYCPSLYKVTYREDGSIRSFKPSIATIPSVVKAVRQVPFKGPVCRSKIITPSAEFSNILLVELNRGCGYSCRFCAAGYIYRPPRLADEKEMIALFDELLAENARIGLISPSVSDVPGIERLTGYILEQGGDFSISSLRANSLTAGLIENLKRSSQKTLTIAPETGSERLRRVINKKLTNREIIDAIVLVGKTGFFHIKLYFMIGLPTERQEDTKAIVTLVKEIRHHLIKESRGRKRIGRIRLSISCFVPKPFTPFQWFPIDDVDSLKEKQKFLRRTLVSEGGIGVSVDVPKWAYVQTLLSMGDRRVGQMLLATHRNGGNWKQTFRSSDINPDFFVYRPKDLNETLPWDFIDHGIKKSFLQEEYNLALQEKESSSCDVGTCTRCGVCT